VQRSTLHLSEAAGARNPAQTNVGMQPRTRHPRFADSEMRRCREFGNFPILHSACPGRTTVYASASLATLESSIRSLLQLSSRCLINSPRQWLRHQVDGNRRIPPTALNPASTSKLISHPLYFPRAKIGRWQETSPWPLTKLSHPGRQYRLDVVPRQASRPLAAHPQPQHRPTPEHSPF
jgi:hypothetical protein